MHKLDLEHELAKSRLLVNAAQTLSDAGCSSTSIDLVHGQVRCGGQRGAAAQAGAWCAGRALKALGLEGQPHFTVDEAAKVFEWIEQHLPEGASAEGDDVTLTTADSCFVDGKGDLDGDLHLSGAELVAALPLYFKPHVFRILGASLHDLAKFIQVACP